MKLVTAEQMRLLEQRAVEAGLTLDELMEAAGLAVAQEAWLTLGVVAGRRILVLCGPGNNGGDGLVAARHLADWEADVVVYLLRQRDDDGRLAALRQRNVPLYAADADTDFALLQQALDGAELIVDALLGTGRSRPIAGALAEVMQRVGAAGGRPRPPEVIAVDLPTGIDADSGTADPLAVRANETVTFGLAKVGLYTLPGSDYAGRVQVVDIGIPKVAEASLPIELLATPWVRGRLPPRPKASNKGTFGRVLVVAGSASYAGAPRLAAEASYRTGAGLVTIACSRWLQAAIAPALPEATYLLLGDADAIDAAGARAVAEQLPHFEVILIGPGLSQSPSVREGVLELLAAASRAGTRCVIDADALNALAATDVWQDRIPQGCVLTPHPGEMGRLLGVSTADVQVDRLNFAVKAAAEWEQIVVLKGAHTIVAAPDGRAQISPHANPLLATAGTGDVLAGAIAGLLAQGLAPFDAAACGVYIHGLAAEEAAADFSDRGLIAGDLLPALPRAIRTVREGKRMPALASPFTAMQQFGSGEPAPLA